MASETASIDGPLPRLERSATQAANWLIDLVFPATCGNCGRVDFRFCDGCRRKLQEVPLKVSPEEAAELDGLCATGAHHGVLRNALGALKYEGAKELAEPLAARLIMALQEWNWRIDAIVPVPLFADREEERGYNQSTLLSQYVVDATGIRHRPDCLIRVRATSQQARLSAHKRRENVKDAFEASNDVKGLSLLLIDDVVTTGSTLSECAIALRARGAGAVYGIAVSHP